jgi:hypothetical protein
MMECPDDFGDVIGDLMVQYGPDRHRDGCDIIAKKVWEYLSERINMEYKEFCSDCGSEINGEHGYCQQIGDET